MDLVDVSKLASVLREFAEEREWTQFHTPKNLAMALGGEAGELVAVLQWLTNEQVANALSADGQVRRELTDEIARSACHWVISDCSHILQRPRPRSTTGLGMST
jgi:NTP pyrophosphatase (non-canonical NTP hydrolase)